MSALLMFLLALPSNTMDRSLDRHHIVRCARVVELRAVTPFIDMRLLVSNRALTRTYGATLSRYWRSTPCFMGSPSGWRPPTGSRPRGGVAAAADGPRRRAVVATGLGAQPGPRSVVVGAISLVVASSRSPFSPPKLPFTAIVRRHLAFRDRNGNRRRRKPDRSLHPGSRRACRHRCRALPHLRLCGLHRVVDCHRNHLPPQRHRLRHAPGRATPRRGEHRRAASDGVRRHPQVSGSFASGSDDER